MPKRTCKNKNYTRFATLLDSSQGLLVRPLRDSRHRPLLLSARPHPKTHSVKERASS
jgi:hypothetical protein